MQNNILIKVFFRPLIILISICFYCLGFGQAARFYLQIDRTKVEEGQSVMLEVVLENINNEKITLPDLSPFKIIQGPSTSMSTTIINGKSTSSLTKTYILQAPKKGKYIISPATITLGSKTLKTNSVNIEVVPPSANTSLSKSESKGETFIRLELDDTKAYLGQQVVVNFVIYTRQNISSYNLLSEFKPEGFYSEPVQNIRDSGQKKIINGKEFYTQVIGRRILYPQKAGEYTLGPLQFTIDIPVEGRSSFFFTDTKTEQISSNALKLKIYNLPETDDISFCGGVGNFEMKAGVKKTQVQVGESIVLQLMVQGDGDPKMVKAPIFEVPTGLEKYDPTLVQDEVTEQGDKKILTKVWEYIFIPKKDTIYQIQPRLSYFSPENGKFQILTADPINIVVTKSDGSVQTLTQDSLSIEPFISKDSKLTQITPTFWMANWSWITIVSVLIMTTIGIYYKRHNSTKARLKETTYSNAEHVAKRNLEAALSFKNNADPKAFYEEISKATTGYILKKYKIPNIEASTINIKYHLETLKIPSDTIQLYIQLQNECELAKFANVYQDMDKTYQNAQELINLLESPNT